MGIATYGPRNPVPPTLATRGSLLRGAWEPRLQTAPQEPKILVVCRAFSTVLIDLDAQPRPPRDGAPEDIFSSQIQADGRTHLAGASGIQRGGENDRNDGRVSRVKVGSRNRVAARISTIRKAAVVAAMALVLAKASADKTRLTSKGRYRPHSIMRKFL